MFTHDKCTMHNLARFIFLFVLLFLAHLLRIRSSIRYFILPIPFPFPFFLFHSNWKLCNWQICIEQDSFSGCVTFGMASKQNFIVSITFCYFELTQAMLHNGMCAEIFSTFCEVKRAILSKWQQSWRTQCTAHSTQHKTHNTQHKTHRKHTDSLDIHTDSHGIHTRIRVRIFCPTWLHLDCSLYNQWVRCDVYIFTLNALCLFCFISSSFGCNTQRIIRNTMNGMARRFRRNTTKPAS